MNYTKATNFASKDSLLTGDPQKLIKGTEINTEFDAIATAISSKQDNLPTGIIALWSGAIAAVPSGWAICDGLNGTPDLRSKFVVGAGAAAGNYAVGATGGSKDAVVVDHTHGHTLSGSTSTDGAHTHSLPRQLTDPFSGDGPIDSSNHTGPSERDIVDGTTTGTGAHSHSVSISGSISAAGVSGTDKNLPPYYALAYIMKL